MYNIISDGPSTLIGPWASVQTVLVSGPGLNKVVVFSITNLLVSKCFPTSKRLGSIIFYSFIPAAHSRTAKRTTTIIVPDTNFNDPTFVIKDFCSRLFKEFAKDHEI